MMVRRSQLPGVDDDVHPQPRRSHYLLSVACRRPVVYSQRWYPSLLVRGWHWTPLVMLICLADWRRFRPNLTRAEARRYRVAAFRYITFPCSRRSDRGAADSTIDALRRLTPSTSSARARVPVGTIILPVPAGFAFLQRRQSSAVVVGFSYHLPLRWCPCSGEKRNGSREMRRRHSLFTDRIPSALSKGSCASGSRSP